MVLNESAKNMLLDALNKSDKMMKDHGPMSWQSDQANQMLYFVVKAIVENSDKGN